MPLVCLYPHLLFFSFSYFQVGSSNIYLGLKTGGTFGPQLFGAIFGFAILKSLSSVLPESGLVGRVFGGPFGPKENCTVQRYFAMLSCRPIPDPPVKYSAATAAGGLGIIFVTGIPAMYRLGLLSDLPQKDVGKLLALAACCGLFGVFFVIPLRKYYIVYQKLTFPTPAATVRTNIFLRQTHLDDVDMQAYTIRSLHSGRAGAVAAKKKALMLFYSFNLVFGVKVMSGYAPGIVRLTSHHKLIHFAHAIFSSMTGILVGPSTDLDLPV